MYIGKVNLLSMILAQISEPMPDWGQPCSTVTRWLVFITDLPMVSISKGRSDRRLITSASIPWPARSLAASKQSSTAFEWATSVMCFPAVKNVYRSYTLYGVRTSNLKWQQKRFSAFSSWNQNQCYVIPIYSNNYIPWQFVNYVSYNIESCMVFHF